MATIAEAKTRAEDLLNRNKSIVNESAQRWKRYTTESCPIDTRDKANPIFQGNNEEEIKLRGAFESEIVRNRVNMGLAQPFSLKIKEEAEQAENKQKKLTAFYEENDLHLKCKDIMANTGACGASAVYMYMPEEKEEADAIAIIDLKPWEYAIMRDSKGRVLYALRIWVEAIALNSEAGAMYHISEMMKEAGGNAKEGISINILKCEYVDADNYYYFRSTKGTLLDELAFQQTAITPDEMEPMQGAPNFFGSVPIVEFVGLKGRRPYYFESITWIDAYNILTTDSISEFDAIRTAILLLKNYYVGDTVDENGDVTETTKSQMKRARVLKMDENGSAEWLIKDIPVNAFVELEKCIRRNIDRFSCNIDYSDTEIYGKATNLSIQARMHGLKLAAKDMCDAFEKGLKEMISVANGLWTTAKKGSQSIKKTDVKCEFTFDVPINAQEEVANFVALKGAGIATEDALTQLSFVKNPAEWAERAMEEIEQIMTQQPTENAGSNDNNKST